MPEYRAYLVGRDGHFVGFEPIVCGDDSEATEKAKRLVDGHDVELWENARMVVSLKHHCDKPTSSITHEIHDGRMVSKPAH